MAEGQLKEPADNEKASNSSEAIFQAIKMACTSPRSAARQKARKQLNTAVIDSSFDEMLMRHFNIRDYSVKKWTLETIKALELSGLTCLDRMVDEGLICQSKDVVRETLDLMTHAKQFCDLGGKVPVLVRLACTHETTDIRRKAVAVFALFVEQLDAIADVLVKYSMSHDVAYVHNATEAVVTIEKDKNDLVMKFLMKMEEQALGRRIKVYAALCKAGATNLVMPVLLDCFKKATLDKHKALLVEAVGEIGMCNSEVVSVLKGFLADDSADLRRLAAKSIAMLGEGASEVVEDLTGLLKDNNSRVKSSAARALARMGVKASASASDLKKAFSPQCDWQVRLDIIDAFAAVSADEKQVTAMLMDNLQDKNGEVRRVVMNNLSRRRPPGDLPPTLKKAFQSNFKDVRVFAVRYGGEHFYESLSVKNALEKFNKSLDGEEVGVAKWIAEKQRNLVEVNAEDSQPRS